jgi:hypothetical protein
VVGLAQKVQGSAYLRRNLSAEDSDLFSQKFAKKVGTLTGPVTVTVERDVVVREGCLSSDLAAKGFADLAPSRCGRGFLSAFFRVLARRHFCSCSSHFGITRSPRPSYIDVKHGCIFAKLP